MTDDLMAVMARLQRIVEAEGHEGDLATMFLHDEEGCVYNSRTVAPGSGENPKNALSWEQATLADIALLLAAVARGQEENEALAQGARGAIQTAAMMLVKLGGSARFTPLDQVTVAGRVTRTDEPDGSFTLTLDTARAATGEG